MAEMDLDLVPNEYQPRVVFVPGAITLQAASETEGHEVNGKKGNLPTELFRIQQEFANTTVKALRFEPGSEDYQSLIEFSEAAMKTDFIVSSAMAGSSLYFGAMAMEIIDILDRRRKPRLFSQQTYTAMESEEPNDKLNEKMSMIRNNQVWEYLVPQMQLITQKHMGKNFESELTAYPYPMDIHQMMLLRLEAGLGTHGMVDLVRENTKKSLLNADSYMVWTASKLATVGNPDNLSDEKIDFVDSCIGTVISLSAAEQSPKVVDRQEMILRGSWSKSIVLMRDLVCSIVSPELFKVVNKSLSDLTGIENPTHRLFLYSNKNFLLKMYPDIYEKLFATTQGKTDVSVIADQTFKGVAKTIMRAVDVGDSENNRVRELLSHVRGDGEEVNEDTEDVPSVVSIWRRIRNLDLLLQVRKLLANDPEQNQLPEVIRWVKAADELKKEIQEKIEQVRDIGRMRYVLDNQQWVTVIEALTQQNAPLEIWWMETDADSNTKFVRNETMADYANRENLTASGAAIKLRTEMTEWLNKPPKGRKFAAVFLHEKFGDKHLPVEFQFIPEECFIQDWDAHGPYKEK
jgi:hypothetical protein